MSFLAKIGLSSNGKGLKCTTTPEGIQQCMVVKTEGNEFIQTGTHFGLQQDPTTCEVNLVGDRTVMDEDREFLAEEIESLKSGCRKRS